MRNEHLWSPTKFEMHNGRWRGSRDRNQVAIGSRHIADLIATAYANALTSYASGRLVDLGCGKVPLYGQYRPLVDTITCVDWPNSDHTTSHLDHLHDLSQPLPFSDNSFDTIVATDLLEHLPYPEAFWSETARILAPEGNLILGVPFMYWIHERPHDHQRYTDQRLRLFCQDHGLKVLTCEPYGGATDVLADLLGKLLDRGALRPISTMIPHVAGLRKSIEPNTPLPLGYVLVATKPRSSGR